jgi:hypothetical protein
MTKTNIAQLKQGDIVSYYGGLFQVTEAPRESQGHRPQAAHLTTAHGPTNCAVVKAVCVEGEVPGYFKPGTPWTFQGTVGGLHAVYHAIH